MQWATQARESRRIGAGEASQSSGGELAHRSSAIYASGQLKNTGSSHDAVRCSTMQRKRLYSDRMRTRVSTTALFRPDQYSASPPLIQLFASPRLALPRVLIYSCSRLIHIYCIRAYPPLTRIRSNARFREFVTDNGKRKSFLNFVSIGCDVTKLKCATSRMEERRLKRICMAIILTSKDTSSVSSNALPVLNHFDRTFVLSFKKIT